MIAARFSKLALTTTALVFTVHSLVELPLFVSFSRCSTLDVYLFYTSNETASEHYHALHRRRDLLLTFKVLFFTYM
jgi:hypothetical protein